MAHQIFAASKQFSFNSATAYGPDCLRVLATRTTIQDLFSTLHPSSSAYINISFPIAKAYLAAIEAKLSDGDLSDLSCQQITKDTYVAELYNSATDLSTVIHWNVSSGAIRGCILGANNAVNALPTINANADFDMSPIFAPIVSELLDADVLLLSNPAKGALSFSEAKVEFDETTAKGKEILYTVSDYVYYAITNGHVKLNIAADGNIPMLSSQALQMDTYTGTVLFGKPHFMKSKKTGITAQKTTVSDATQEFEHYTVALEWTEEEKMLIPTFPSDFPVSDEVLLLARRFVGTTGDKRPMRQFMWRGPTSIGKSTGIEVLACILQTPLLRMTAFSTMETNDMKADFVPDTKGAQGNPDDVSFMEISCFPSAAYEKLTGETKEDVTAEECFAKYKEACASRSSENSPKFKFVESNYVKALKKGYILEFQEVSRIKDSGVLVGLNEFDRPGAIIPLLDGSSVKRHENAMVVYTDNTNYDSCRDIDPSVLRRMALIIDSDSLSKKQLFERVKYNTGCADTLLTKLYKIWAKIEVYCRENQLLDEGSFSPTEFEFWVRAVMLDGEESISNNARTCVINKITTEKDIQNTIMDTIVGVMA